MDSRILAILTKLYRSKVIFVIRVKAGAAHMMDEQQRRLVEEVLFSDVKKAGFGKRLYFGAFDPNLIFPFPTISPEERPLLSAYLEKVRAFIDKEIDPDWIDRHAEIPPSVINGLGKLGVLGMSVPKEFGGLGMSQLAYCQVVEAISSRCASTALLINAHQSIGLRALLLFGTKAQQETWLEPLAKGEKIAAFSLTEVNAGSDASGIESRAIYDPIKNVYRINGNKQWTTSGSIAKVLTVMAKTAVETPQGLQDKVTAFLVTPNMPGFKVVEPGLEKVGMRGTRTANLQFTDMEVPAENVLGPIGGGLKVCLTVLDFGRTTFGAMCTGAAKFLLEKSIAHAKSRYQFKRPLAAFGLVKKKLATMAALTYAMESATMLTAGLIDRGSEDIMLESAMLKVFASESEWSILYDAMQIFGGRSFFTSYPLERMMRDARLNMIGEGSNEVMRAFIGAVGMRDVGLELKTFADALKQPLEEKKLLSKMVPQLFSRLSAPRIPIQSSELNQESRDLSNAIRRFGWAVGRLLAYYREDIVEKQFELERIAESAIAIFVMTSVLSRLDTKIILKDPDLLSPNELETGKLYCTIALENIDRNLSALFSPHDKAFEQLSDNLTGIKTS